MGNQISDIAGIRKQANGTRWQPASLDASGAMDGWCEHAACTQPPAASFDWNWSPAGAMCSSADDQGARQRGEFCSTGQAPSHRGVQVEDVSAGQLVSAFGSPMHAASMLGTAADIANLASAGHGYEGTDRIGRTPCHLAAIAGNLKNLKTLVDLGANFEVEDHYGRTPLQSAVFFNRHQVVQWIKWRIWSKQGKFGDGHASPRSLPSNGAADTAAHGMQSSDLSMSGSSAYEHSAFDYGGSQSCHRRGTAFSIPVTPSRGRRDADTSKIGTEDDNMESKEDLNTLQPEFAWREAQMDGEVRRLAGILRLVIPDLDLGTDDLKEIIRQSEDDMVAAIVLAQDRYGAQF